MCMTVSDADSGNGAQIVNAVGPIRQIVDPAKNAADQIPGGDERRKRRAKSSSAVAGACDPAIACS